MMRVCRILLLALAALPAVSAAAEYKIYDIGTLRNSGTGLYMKINNQGQVVGTSLVGGDFRGWTWTEQGGITPMPHGQGLISETFAGDINDSGMVSGSALVNGSWYAYRWSAGPGYEFLNPIPERTDSWGHGLNNLGVIVGGSSTNGQLVVTKWGLDGVPKQLDHYGLDEVSSAWDINDSGTAVGSAELAGVERAVRFSPNGNMFDVHSLLPTGTKRSELVDLNASGTSVGIFLDGEDRWRSFYLKGDQVEIVDLPDGFLRSQLSGVNATGVGAGWLGTDPLVDGVAAVHTDQHGMRNMNTLIEPNSGWQLSYAEDVNDDGWIVGRGTLNGVETNFLAKPVPEPGTLLALGLGALTLLRRRR